MVVPKPKWSIELTPEEEQALRKVADSSTERRAKVVRARILLAAHEHPDWSSVRIAEVAGCQRRNVRKWRHRWAERRSIEDLPRPGAPRKPRKKKDADDTQARS